MIICKDEDFYLVRIFREYLDKIDIFDKDMIGELFQKIILKMKKRYDIQGLFDIDVYFNDDYGMIMEFVNIDEDEDGIDLQIHFHIDSIFLCEVDSSCLNYEKENYYYKGKYYTNYTRSMDSSVIYQNCLDIINHGIKIS